MPTEMFINRIVNFLSIISIKKNAKPNNKKTKVANTFN